jgi:hypothetical protein
MVSQFCSWALYTCRPYDDMMPTAFAEQKTRKQMPYSLVDVPLKAIFQRTQRASGVFQPEALGRG